MPITGSGGFSYVRRYATWQVNDAWRSRIRAQAQSYLSDAQTTRSAFATAWNNQITGAASLAGQAAIDRIRAATGALQKSAQSVNLSV